MLNKQLIKTEFKKNIAIGMPLIASQLIYSFSGFLGTLMIARLGKEALAASVLVSMTWAALSTLFFGVLNSVSVLVSHQYSAKQEGKISKIMGQAYILGVIIAGLILLSLSSLPLFLHLTKQPPQVLQLAYRYIHALRFTVPGLVFIIITEQFLMGIGRAKLVLRISLLVVPIEICMLYLLVFGKLGLPKFGIAGIGYGFSVSYTATAIGLIIYLFFAKKYKKYHLFSALNKINWSYLKELVRIGLPMGGMQLIEVGAFAVITFWISQFGTTILAAHQIALQFLGFIITIVFAMSQTVTIRVGYAVGEQDLLSVKYAAYTGLGLNFCLMLVISLIFFFLPTWLLRLDINIHSPANAILIEETKKIFFAGGFLILFDNFRIISFGALRGIKDTRFPMYTSFIGFLIIGLSLAYLFAFVLHYSGVSIWWGITLGIASGAILNMLRLHHLLGKVDLAKILAIT